MKHELIKDKYTYYLKCPVENRSWPVIPARHRVYMMCPVCGKVRLIIVPEKNKTWSILEL